MGTCKKRRAGKLSPLLPGLPPPPEAGPDALTPLSLVFVATDHVASLDRQHKNGHEN